MNKLDFNQQIQFLQVELLILNTAEQSLLDA